MSDFVNTIDLLGDEVVANSVIDRSITEFNDNVLTSVRRYAFSNCTALTSANLPNVTSVGDHAFDNCSKLSSVDFTGLTNIGEYVFFCCSSLAIVDLPNVIKIGNLAFSQCTKLVSVSLPSITGSLNASTFYSCSALKEVYVPNATQSGSYTFQNCRSLEYLDLPKFKLISNGNFKGCSSLKTLILRLETGCTLPVTDAFNGTPFASGGTGGKCLVPRALIETFYQTGTNWSAMYAEGTCTFLALEDYTVDGTITGAIDWDKLNGGTT
jgi:hypothetical protein